MVAACKRDGVHGRVQESPRMERDVCRFHCDVGASSDRNADVGLRERGRVVDAVADERDDGLVGRRLQPLDLGDF